MTSKETEGSLTIGMDELESIRQDNEESVGNS